MNSIEKWLSVEEIAQHLSISKETVYRWVEKRTIPAHKVGKQWRFQVTEVDEWVKAGGAAGSGRAASTKSRKRNR